MPTAKLKIEYNDIDDLRSILRGLRQREGRDRRRVLNMARLIAITSLADAIEQHIHDVTTARLLPSQPVERKPVTCRAQFRPGIELYCTRPKYHKGDHFERRGNAIVGSWPRVDNESGQRQRKPRRKP